MCFQHEQFPGLPDRLLGELIGLARATDGNGHLINPGATAVIIDSLTNTDDSAVEALRVRVEREKRKMIPDCFACAAPCGRNNAYDMKNLWNADAEVRALKCRLISEIRRLAARNPAEEFLYQALIVIGMDDYRPEDLLPIIRKAEELNR